MSGRRTQIILIAGAALLAVLLVVFLVLPKMSAVNDAKTQLDTATAQQQSLESQLAALQQAQDEADKNKAIIARVNQEIPPTADESGFILLLSNAATRAGIKLWQFTPSTPTLNTTTNLSEIPVTFTVKGNYFALAEFLFNIETLPRVAKVQNATVSPSGETTSGSTSSVPFLQMTGAVTFYTTDTDSGPGTDPGTGPTGTTTGSTSSSPTAPAG